jgi:4-hydroxy-3-polyprenylbenzoate decarboxylase
MSASKPVVLGLTGASGSILGLRLLKELLLLKVPVDVIFSEHASLVMQQELGVAIEGHTLDEKKASLLRLIKLEASTYGVQLTLYSNKNIGAKPASGTHLHRGMVIAPCSMGTLAHIAQGMSDSLLTRAADVTLKEGRPLILLPRETPFNAIHLQNMLTLAQLNVRIIPPMLSFYSPDFLSLEGQILYTVGKVLDQLGLDHQLYQRWQGLSTTLQSPELAQIYETLL